MKKKEDALDHWSLPFRHALMKGIGFSTDQLRKPLIGVLNGWGEINPAAGHLGRLAGQVKLGIAAAGGCPIEFSVSSLCGGIAGGSRGSSYALAYRDVVADYVELIAEVNQLDGLVFTTVCDDVVPAHLMAAARVNIPSIIVLGGYMSPKQYKGRSCHAIQVGTGYGEMEKGLMSREEFEGMVDAACGNWGACPVMGTGNTMGVIAETLGMTLPGNSTTSGSDPLIGRLAHEAGVRIMSLLAGGVRPSGIMTRESFENAIRVFLAVGGSTNALIHLPAVAGELGMALPLSLFDALSRQTPFICNVKPSGKHTLKELDEAGGLPALLKELQPLLHAGAPTVTGKTLGENIAGAEVLNRQVIYPLSAPLSAEGGVVILQGTLAPSGAAVKISGLVAEQLARRGQARVFESEKEACERLLAGAVRPGDMVVIRNVGPKGDPGMRITARFLWLLVGMGLDTSVTLISDGRFSGTNKGGAICHVSPEAAAGGPIALVRDGDWIEVDIPGRRVDLLVGDEVLAERRKAWRPPQAEFGRGLLSRISKTMLPVEQGAVLGRG
ncbi:MAG: dihydroxy-acid dehydratase [Deltaproteobacteria bacterium]|nr:dihydroxy-acid dehydratase [Deltaproteobacteria bacterium]